MSELTPLIPALEDPENVKKFNILNSRKNEYAYRCVMWLKEMLQRISQQELVAALTRSTGHSPDEVDEFVKTGSGNVEAWEQANDGVLRVLAGQGKEVEIAEKDSG